jgi:Uma2 family endonuclease
MVTIATKPMSAAEFFEFVHRPANAGRWFELERGEVIELPPPGKKHGFVCNVLAWLLTNYSIQATRGYVCTNDTGMVVEEHPDTVRGVDVSYYDDDADAATMETGYAYLPPLVAAEVLSPSDKPGRVLRRISEYLKRNVSLVWIIDPENRTATTYRRGRDPVTLDETQELAGEDVLPGFSCRVAELFRSPGGRRGRAKKNGKGPRGKKPRR